MCRKNITLTAGSQNDFSLVTQWFRSMIDKYDIRPLWVGYDPWNSQYWIKKIEDMCFEMEKIDKIFIHLVSL